jgi:hypothetical protein
MHCEARGLKQGIVQDRSVSPRWGLNQRERATNTPTLTRGSRRRATFWPPRCG